VATKLTWSWMSNLGPDCCFSPKGRPKSSNHEWEDALRAPTPVYRRRLMMACLQQNKIVTFFVASESVLLLLPEPVTCFCDASYNQIQKFEISEGGSAVILDWITSGRMSRGEEWAFSRYYSVNDIWYNGKRVAKDVTLLDNHNHDVRIPKRPLQNKLQPYSCYAMLFLYGPRVHHIIADLVSQYDKISILKSKVPSQLIWSTSPIDSTGRGVVVRVGGDETETVKAWLKQTLSGIEHIIGKDAYGRIFS